MRIIRKLSSFLLMIGLAVAGQPHFSFAADEYRGRMLAERHCTSCHKIAHEGVTAAVPPLTSFGEKWPLSFLEEALAEGIVTGHDNNMPTFTFMADEIEDLLAYIESLSKLSDS